MAYNLFVPGREEVGWSKVLWQPLVVPKHVVITWMVIQGQLATRDLLRRFGMCENTSRCFCGEGDKSHRQIWNAVCRKMMFNGQRRDLAATIALFCDAGVNLVCKMRVVALCSTVYTIW